MRHESTGRFRGADERIPRFERRQDEIGHLIHHGVRRQSVGYAHEAECRRLREVASGCKILWWRRGVIQRSRADDVPPVGQNTPVQLPAETVALQLSEHLARHAPVASDAMHPTLRPSPREPVHECLAGGLPPHEPVGGRIGVAVIVNGKRGRICHGQTLQGCKSGTGRNPAQFDIFCRAEENAPVHAET